MLPEKTIIGPKSFITPDANRFAGEAKKEQSLYHYYLVGYRYNFIDPNSPPLDTNLNDDQLYAQCLGLQASTHALVERPMSYKEFINASI
jgi:hypothetical protein